MQKVVKEGYDEVVKALGWEKKPAGNESASRALAKGKVVAQPRGTVTPPKKETPSQAKKAMWDEAGDQAWDEYQKTLKAQG